MSAGDTAAASGGLPPDKSERASDDATLAILRELVRLKDLKDREGATADYRRNKDAAWDAARRILETGKGEMGGS